MIRLKSKLFEEYIRLNAISKTIAKYNDSIIQEIKIEDSYIKARVLGTRYYEVEILMSPTKIISSKCTCPYDGAGICKHIVNAFVTADLQTNKGKNEPQKKYIYEFQEDTQFFHVPTIHWNNLNYELLRKLSKDVRVDQIWYDDSQWLDGNYFYNRIEAGFRLSSKTHQICIYDKEDGLYLKCSCETPKELLCQHLIRALKYYERDFLDPVFDIKKREQQLKIEAEKLGLEIELDKLVDILEFKPYQYGLKPKSKYNLISVNHPDFLKEKENILEKPPLPWEQNDSVQNILVIQYNSYHQTFAISVLKAKKSKSGSLKSPIQPIKQTEAQAFQNNLENSNFFNAASLLNNRYDSTAFDDDELFLLYKNLIKNPLQFPIYELDDDSGKITPTKLIPNDIRIVDANAEIYVVQQNDFYEISCKILFENHTISTTSIRLLDRFFFRYNKLYYFIDSKRVAKLIRYFSSNQNRLFVHASQFEKYKETFLNELENFFTVHYTLTRKAVKKEKHDAISSSINPEEIQKVIYLSDAENYVVLTPAIRYGNKELPLYSRRNLYVELPTGVLEERPRNEWLERGFKRLIRDLHPDFEVEPLHEFVYLSRQEFLESGWFLDAFEKLKADNVQLFGFSQLSKNRFNENKAIISTRLSSGIDWFDIEAKIQFGNQFVDLEVLQKAILKRSSFVELGDGTQGILPEEWVERFGKFFRSGEVKDDSIRVHRTNFQLIDDLFRDEAIDHQVRETLNELTGKLNDFKSISSVKIPKKLKAELRDYQKEGLNWLHFLDEFGFGGVLADDMGLGKTIQIIAYILSQHEKGNKDANLIVVPTSLIFNWKNEVKKFAPHLKIIELWGPNRDTKNTNFSDFDIVLISYGTLLSDIEYLRKYRFNLLILDESQAIKNPSSKRYKAVRLLQGRQNLALTGTPVENNTFDLFAQLSFAMPGLLGSSRSFLELYAAPIDKFQDTKRAKELQRKVHPFVLRRTKKQVAKELPEKTEMVVFCEMDKEQREVYNAFKKDFVEKIKSKTDDELRKDSTLVLQGMMKLRQICDSPAILNGDGDFGSESAKILELMAQIEDKKDNHKILVFSQFVSMLELIRQQLEKAGIGYCLLTGETRDRQAKVDQFQNDDQTRVFLISLKAGGTGLNLTQADYVYIVDPWWNPAVENQAIDRAYRIGQDKHVVAIRLVTPDSIEEKMLELQERKRQLAGELIHTDNAVMKALSKNDLLELIV